MIIRLTLESIRVLFVPLINKMVIKFQKRFLLELLDMNLDDIKRMA